MRHFGSAGVPPAPYNEVSSQPDDISIICRCNDIDIKQLHDLIAQGFTSIDEIKRISRLGMGPCQGRNCVPLVLAELSCAMGKNVSEISPGTYRPVTRSVSLAAIAAYSESKETLNE
ncbi:MAG: (2Fe-2S)-binding protein [Defluviitaleaceae bacterium]|nr:(2Fe-2S)-binding protein [Defluviitaleaceae bacterium]MCL2836066.1 (2Fe-2S)-binding protein [Defluviitaleaceae bacterium]